MPARFANLASAGDELAPQLQQLQMDNRTVVLGVAAGGVPAARVVADALGLPFDLLLLRRLLQSHTGQPLAAAWVAGRLVCPNDITDAGVLVADALHRLAERNHCCRGARPPLSLEGKSIVLVDDGVHTGGTMRLAIDALRSLAVGPITIAVPVANVACRELLHDLADAVVCGVWVEPFPNVAAFYRNFDVPESRQIHALFAAPACAL